MYPTSTVTGPYYANFRPPVIPPSVSPPMIDNEGPYRIIDSGAEPLPRSSGAISEPFTLRDLVNPSPSVAAHMANYLAAPTRGCRCRMARPTVTSPRLVYNPSTKKLSTDVNHPFSPR